MTGGSTKTNAVRDDDIFMLGSSKGSMENGDRLLYLVSVQATYGVISEVYQPFS